jgi:hypothetical protein
MNVSEITKSDKSTINLNPVSGSIFYSSFTTKYFLNTNSFYYLKVFYIDRDKKEIQSQDLFFTFTSIFPITSKAVPISMQQKLIEVFEISGKKFNDVYN